MLLRSATIENFRAVKFAKLCFDPTTVLIGENDCGRSSVMEAVALALGWNSGETEFRFQPFHVHRSLRAVPSEPSSSRIVLEFGESADREWDGESFGILRGELPSALAGNRRLVFEVTHCADGISRWTFRSR